MELKSGYLCPPGYKQTEVGVIPEEWEVVTAAAACELVVDCKNRTPPVVAGGEFAVVRTPNVRAGKFVREDLRFTDEVSFREWTARAVPKVGDILITREAPLGEVCLVPDDLKVCLGQRMMLYRPDTTRTESAFLLYALTSTAVQSNLLRMIGGSTVGHAKVDDIRFLEFPLPQLPEQRAIAEALSDIDELIGALDQLIAKKRDLKQATIQQLLTGQTRLPGFSGEWEVVKAGDIGRFRGGSGFPTKFQGTTSGVYPFFKVSDMNNEGNETFMETANNYISEGLRKHIGATAFPAKSIVFAKVGAAVFLERKKILTKASCLDNNMAAFVLDEGRADYRFIHYVLLNTKLGDLVSTTALPSLSGRMLAVIEFDLPPLPEQTAITEVLSDMDAELAALEQRRDKTRALKHGMMQELLTGRTRLV